MTSNVFASVSWQSDCSQESSGLKVTEKFENDSKSRRSSTEFSVSVPAMNPPEFSDHVLHNAFSNCGK